MGQEEIPTQPQSRTLEVRECGVSFKSNLQVCTLEEAKLGEFSSQLIRKLENFRLTPNDFSLKSDDDLFAYHLQIIFFNGFGLIDIRAAEIEAHFKGIATQGDLDIAFAIFTTIQSVLGNRITAESMVTYMAHAIFKQVDEADFFLSRLCPPGWSFGGRSAVRIEQDASKEGVGYEKLSFEKSHTYRNAAFLMLEIGGFSFKNASSAPMLWECIAKPFSEFGLNPTLKGLV